jgi:hypothetical protein
MKRCFLWDKCKTEHEQADKRFTDKLFFVGKLFPLPICAHCIMRLSRLTEATPTDLSVNEMEAFKAEHPEYAALVEELGVDKVRFELDCNMAEANPSGLPVRPEQVENYPRVEQAPKWIRR